MLIKWGHKMGPNIRPTFGETERWNHALYHDGVPIAVTTTNHLIRERVGGIEKSGLNLNRKNCIELSRLCADRPHLCRVMLRLWREFVFPTLGYRYAISYQDADIHNGNTYRFDGWKCVGYSRASTAIDQRTGRQGRNKRVWLWELPSPPSSPDKEVEG